jgi:putative ABC transport system permease protein
MFQHHLKLALRNFRKDKSTFLINLTGLSVGLMVAISIFSWAIHELSYEKFHTKSDQIYRIVNERFQNGEMIQKGTITYPTIGPTMLKEYPEVVNASRIFYQGNMALTNGDKVIQVDDSQFTDQHFFELFDYELLAGDRNTALSNTNEIVLTKSVANQLFDLRNDNYESLIGKYIVMNLDEHPSKVVGIIKDFPVNSIFQCSVLASYATFIRYTGENADISWDFSDFYHFIELDKQADPAILEAKFPAFSEKHFVYRNDTESAEKFYLQPLSDVHLYSADLEYEIMKTGSARSVWALLGIAFIILLIAWVNYINLSSVKAIEKAKEIGLRRVIGAGKKQLTLQFLQEAFLINLLAFLVAIPLITFFRPWFYNIMGIDQGRTISTALGSTEYLLYGGCALLMFSGILISGLYPSWLLSSKSTPDVLKGKFQNTKGSKALRKTLVTAQFTMSISLIIITIFAYQQIKFMDNKELGLNIDQVMVFNGPTLTNFDTTFIDKMNAFTAALDQFPGIKKAATSNRVPGERMGRIFGLTIKGGNPDKGYMCNQMHADAKYAETYGLQTLAGRFFRQEDSNYNGQLVNNIIINEATRKMAGFSTNEEAIGQVFNFFGGGFNVVGVVNDFHQRSIHHAIEPLIIIPYYSPYSPISVKVAAATIDQTIAQIEQTYQSFFPANVFEYSFLDKQFAQLYSADKNFSKMLLFFTFLAILIACLGLFGLASYIAHLRTKEIGVRKVLGSSITQIVALLSFDFLKLVFVAVLLASPIAWYCSKEWLNSYEYRIAIEGSVFLWAGVIALSTAFLTISAQSLKAALANPVESLRND